MCKPNWIISSTGGRNETKYLKPPPSDLVVVYFTTLITWKEIFRTCVEPELFSFDRKGYIHPCIHPSVDLCNHTFIHYTSLYCRTSLLHAFLFHTFYITHQHISTYTWTQRSSHLQNSTTGQHYVLQKRNMEKGTWKNDIGLLYPCFRDVCSCLFIRLYWIYNMYYILSISCHYSPLLVPENTQTDPSLSKKQIAWQTQAAPEETWGKLPLAALKAHVADPHQKTAK